MSLPVAAVEMVGAVAAVDDVVATAAEDDVVAAVPEQVVGTGVAAEHIVLNDEPLRFSMPVIVSPARVAARTGAAIEIYEDGAVRTMP